MLKVYIKKVGFSFVYPHSWRGILQPILLSQVTNYFPTRIPWPIFFFFFTAILKCAWFLWMSKVFLKCDFGGIASRVFLSGTTQHRLLWAWGNESGCGTHVSLQPWPRRHPPAALLLSEAAQVIPKGMELLLRTFKKKPKCFCRGITHVFFFFH